MHYCQTSEDTADLASAFTLLREQECTYVVTSVLGSVPELGLWGHGSFPQGVHVSSHS